MNSAISSSTTHTATRYITQTLDILFIGCSAYLAHFFRFDNIILADQYVTATIIGCIFAFLILPSFRVYSAASNPSLLLVYSRALVAWCATFILLATLAFGTKTGAEYSRVWATLWFGISAIFLLIGRLLVHVSTNMLRQLGAIRPIRIVIVGAGSLGRSIPERLREAIPSAYEITAFFDDNPALHYTAINGIAVYPIEQSLCSHIQSAAVDEVWLALPLRAEERIKTVLSILRHHPLPIRFVPDIFGFRLLSHSTSELAGLPILTLNLSPITGGNRLIKAMEDYLLSLLIIALTSPLLLGIAIAIKLTSPGPVLFKQRRHGLNGADFTIYKFRTMRLHRETEGQVTQASRTDRRITTVGRLLRRTSLDELPQFFNVLQGHMSIVGPRPHAVEHNELFKDQIDFYMQRHRVKPGITGWAQINGWRGETDTMEKMGKRIEYDLFYIENWSLWLDLKIFVLTILKVVSDRSAY